MKTTILFVILLFAASAVAEEGFDGVLSLEPPAEGACVAVEIPTPAGQALAGIRWFNNDATLPFPRLVVMEGEAGSPPDLDSPALILLDITGTSLQWGEVQFGSPVTSSTGTAMALFFFPAVDTTYLGSGGGPGIGVRVGQDPEPFYLTGDGQTWHAFDRNFELGVEPLYALARGTVELLSEMTTRVEPAPGGAEEGPQSPTRTALLAPSPNPFNPRVKIAYTLARDCEVELKVYDLMGRHVKTLVAEAQAAGFHRSVWDGEDAKARPVASGVYFARFVADGRSESRRMTLIR